MQSDVLVDNIFEPMKHNECPTYDQDATTDELECDSNIDASMKEAFMSSYTEAKNAYYSQLFEDDNLYLLYKSILSNMLRWKDLPSNIALGAFAGHYFTPEKPIKFVESLLHVVYTIFIRQICIPDIQDNEEILNDKHLQEILQIWTEVCTTDMTEVVQKQSQTMTLEENVDLGFKSSMQSFVTLHTSFIMHTYISIIMPILSGFKHAYTRTQKQSEDTDSELAIKNADIYNASQLVDRTGIGNITLSHTTGSMVEIKKEIANSNKEANANKISNTYATETSSILEKIVFDGTLTTFALQSSNNLNVIYGSTCESKENHGVNSECINQFCVDTDILYEFAILLTIVSADRFEQILQLIKKFLMNPRVSSCLMQMQNDIDTQKGANISNMGIYTDLQNLSLKDLKPVYEILEICKKSLEDAKRDGDYTTYNFHPENVDTHSIPTHLDNLCVNCKVKCTTTTNKNFGKIPDGRENTTPENLNQWESTYAPLDISKLAEMLVNKLFLQHHPVFVFKLIENAFNTELECYKRHKKWCDMCNLPGHGTESCFYARKGDWNVEGTSYQQEWSRSKTQMEDVNNDRNKRKRFLREADEQDNDAIKTTNIAITSIITSVVKQLCKCLNVLTNEDFEKTDSDNFAAAICKIFSFNVQDLDKDGQQNNKPLIVMQPNLPLSYVIGMYSGYEKQFWQTKEDVVSSNQPAFVMQRYSKNQVYARVANALCKTTTDNNASDIFLNLISQHAVARNSLILSENFDNIEKGIDYYTSPDITSKILGLNNNMTLFADPRIPNRIFKDILDHIIIGLLIENGRFVSSKLQHKNNILAQRIFFSTDDSEQPTMSSSSHRDTSVLLYTPEEIRRAFGNYDVGLVVPFDSFPEKLSALKEDVMLNIPTKLSRDVNVSKRVILERFIKPQIDGIKQVPIPKTLISFSSEHVDQSGDCVYKFDMGLYYRTNTMNLGKTAEILDELNANSATYNEQRMKYMIDSIICGRPHTFTSIVNFLNSNYACWGTRRDQLDYSRFIYSLILYVVASTRFGAYEHTVAAVGRHISKTEADKLALKLHGGNGDLFSSITTKSSLSTLTVPTTQDVNGNPEGVQKKSETKSKKRKSTNEEDTTEQANTSNMAVTTSTTTQIDDTEAVLERQIQPRKKIKLAHPEPVPEPTVSISMAQDIKKISSTQISLLTLLIRVQNELLAVKNLKGWTESPIIQQRSQNNIKLLPAPTYIVGATKPSQ